MPDLTDGDYNKRVDEFDDDTVRFYESVKPDGYFYELYVLVDGLKSRIIVTKDGVSVDFKESGETIHTNINPNRVFKNKVRLDWDDLLKIINFLEVTEIEGKKYSKKEMDDSYREYLEKGN